MKMRDDKGEDDKLIAVHADDPNYADYSDVSEIPRHRMRELQRFFEDYKALENKKVLVSEPQGRSEALQVLRDAIRLYDQEKERLHRRPARVRHRAAAAASGASEARGAQARVRQGATALAGARVAATPPARRRGVPGEARAARLCSTTMEHALEHIAAAVTPAVMVSACGLVALGLDNQIARMSGRLRELAREFRDDESPPRRAVVARQVGVLELRHRLYSRAILLNYGALFSFVLTSLLWLGQAFLPISTVVPVVTFGVGVLLLAGMAILRDGVHRARAADGARRGGGHPRAARRRARRNGAGARRRDVIDPKKARAPPRGAPPSRASCCR